VAAAREKCCHNLLGIKKTGWVRQDLDSSLLLNYTTNLYGDFDYQRRNGNLTP
jgi:hypothetical protein